MLSTHNSSTLKLLRAWREQGQYQLKPDVEVKISQLLQEKHRLWLRKSSKQCDGNMHDMHVAATKK